MLSIALAREFLTQRRIAVAGVSRDSHQFANALFRTLRERGCDAIPVNPRAAELEGVTAYPSLASLPEPVDGVIFLLPPGALPAALDDALSARIPRLWFRSASGAGAEPALVERARSSGATVIDSGCPYMFMDDAHWFHRFHGAISRLTGEVKA